MRRNTQPENRVQKERYCSTGTIIRDLSKRKHAYGRIKTCLNSFTITVCCEFACQNERKLERLVQSVEKVLRKRKTGLCTSRLQESLREIALILFQQVLLMPLQLLARSLKVVSESPVFHVIHKRADPSRPRTEDNQSSYHLSDFLTDKTRTFEISCVCRWIKRNEHTRWLKNFTSKKKMGNGRFGIRIDAGEAVPEYVKLNEMFIIIKN